MSTLRDQILHSKHIWITKDEKPTLHEISIKDSLITDPTVCCWWCCHPCNRKPLHLPLKYDDRANIFHVSGAYCSFSCVEAAILDHPRTKPLSLYLCSYRRQLEGRKMQRTIAAPPRQTLKMFGGTLSIEEFRAITKENDSHGAYTLQILPPHVIPIKQVIQKKEYGRRTVAGGSNTKQHTEQKDIQLSTSGTSIAMTNFKLKRHNPQKNSNILEKIMNITVDHD